MSGRNRTDTPVIFQPVTQTMKHVAFWLLQSLVLSAVFVLSKFKPHRRQHANHDTHQPRHSNDS